MLAPFPGYSHSHLGALRELPYTVVSRYPFASGA